MFTDGIISVVELFTIKCFENGSWKILFGTVVYNVVCVVAFFDNVGCTTGDGDDGGDSRGTGKF